MTKRKTTAKKGRKVALVAGRDVEPATATGTDVRHLQTELIRQVGATLWLPASLPKEEHVRQIKAAIAMLEGIQPQGEIEGLLAAQMVAAHNAAMECLRRAMREGQPFAIRDQSLKHAAKFMSMYARQVEVLDKHRGKGQQKMTIEHINIESGGQAIVGQVETGKGPKRQEGSATSAKSPAIDDTPEVPLEIPDPVVRQRTPQKVLRKVRRGR